MKIVLDNLDFSQEIHFPLNNHVSQLSSQQEIQLNDVNCVQPWDTNLNPQMISNQRLTDLLQSTKWTQQDEDLLLILHKQFGNKWTRLAQKYPGRSQNYIKNHFYSRLRKSIRKLNKLIATFYHGEFIRFKLNIIFKLSNISEGKISDKGKIDSQIFRYYRELLYRLIQFCESKEIEEMPINLKQDQRIKLQTLALSLVALQNLFRLVRGQRSAKGKKKNIAYLRQFKFRLDAIDPIQLVISKEHIYLKSNQIIAESVAQQIQHSFRIDPSVTQFQDQIDESKHESHTVCQGLTPHLQRIKNINFINSISSLRVEQQQIDFQSPALVSEGMIGGHQDWTDYLGRALQEIDMDGGQYYFNSQRYQNGNSRETLSLDDELFPNNSIYPYYQ